MKWLREKSTAFKVFLAVLVVFFVYYGYSTGKQDLAALPQAVQDSPLFEAFRSEYIYSPKTALPGDLNGDNTPDLAIVYSAGLSYKMLVVLGGDTPLLTEPVPAPKENISLSFDPQTGLLSLSGTQNGATGTEVQYKITDSQLELVDSVDFNL